MISYANLIYFSFRCLLGQIGECIRNNTFSSSASTFWMEGTIVFKLMCVKFYRNTIYDALEIDLFPITIIKLKILFLYQPCNKQLSHGMHKTLDCIISKKKKKNALYIWRLLNSLFNQSVKETDIFI